MQALGGEFMNENNSLNYIIKQIAKTIPKENRNKAMLVILSILKEKAKISESRVRNEAIGIDKLELGNDRDTSNNILDKEENKENTIGIISLRNDKDERPKEFVETIANLQQCVSEQVDISIVPESLVGNFPVILAQINIEISIEALTKFPEEVFTIEDIDKNLIVSSCSIVPDASSIFLEGIIEKKVKYTTVNECYSDRIIGNIKNATLILPFKCCSDLKFSKSPEAFKGNNSIILQVLSPLEPQCNYNKESSVESKKLSHEIYCSLENVKICEYNKKLKTKMLKNTLSKADTFNIMKEKTVISFTISIMQNQQVFIYNENNSKPFDT